MLKSDNAAKSEVEVVSHNLNLTYHINNNDNAMKLIEIEHANEEIKKELDNVDIKKDTYFHEDSLIKELCREDTNLMDAVREQRFDLVKLLLDERAEVNYSDKFFRTPLLIAVRKQNLEIVKLLLEEGAEVNHSDKFFRTPLLIAVRKQNPEIIKLLLEKGADVNYCDQSFIKESEQGLKRILKSSILDLVSDENYCSEYCITPLVTAVRKQNLEIVKLLVERTEVKLFLENTAELNNYDRCWVNQLRWELQNTKRSEITKLFANHITYKFFYK